MRYDRRRSPVAERRYVYLWVYMWADPSYASLHTDDLRTFYFLLAYLIEV